MVLTATSCNTSYFKADEVQDDQWRLEKTVLTREVETWLSNVAYKYLDSLEFLCSSTQWCSHLHSWTTLLRCLFFSFLKSSSLTDEQDNLQNARRTFSFTYMIARSAALVLHFDVALILFRMYSVCCVRYFSLIPNSCVPYSHFFGQTNAPEWHYPVWWVEFAQFI